MLMQDLPDGLSINVADLNEHERPSFAQHEVSHHSPPFCA